MITDCWENEPGISSKHLGLSTISTPHIAGYSQDGKANGTAMSIESLLNFFNLRHATSWYPTEIPEPLSPIIDLSGVTNVEDAIKKAVIHTYPIWEDNRQLTNAPERFEKLRGSYPVRREFGSYKIERAETSEIEDTLKKIGFRI